MSYLIQSPEEFFQADGTPFRVPQRDEKRDLVFRTSMDGTILMGNDGTPMIEMRDATFLEILRNFLNGMFKLSEHRKALAIQNKKEVKPEYDLSMEDSTFAGDIFRAMNTSVDDVIEVEKAPHEWLIRMVDVWGVDLYGINAAVLKEAFKNAEDGGTSRAERHRENGKKSEKEVPAAA
jgi:hypothetical protein